MSPAITTAYGDDTEKVPESLRLVRHPSYRGQTYFGRRPVSSSSGWACWELLPRKRKVSKGKTHLNYIKKKDYINHNKQKE